MRSYPNIYPEPQDAWVAILTSEGTWREGQWVPDDLVVGTARMDYSDLTDGTYDTDADKLETRAMRFQRRFMDEHMETLASAPMKTYFRGGHLRDRGLMELIGGKRRQAPPPFLDFPVDIARDWAVAIGQFHDWIQKEQRSVLGAHGTDTNGVPDHWPEAARWLTMEINEARRSLFPLLNQGANYDEHLRESQDLARRLVSEMLQDEKNEDPTFSVKKPKP